MRRIVEARHEVIRIWTNDRSSVVATCLWFIKYDVAQNDGHNLKAASSAMAVKSTYCDLFSVDNFL